MGIFNRIVDAVDNTVTDAVTRHGAHREAARFASQVRPGDTWYSEETVRTVTGDQTLLQEHTFDRRGRSGHRTAEAVYLNSGRLHRRRPRGLMTLQEYSDHQVAGPDPAAAVEQPKRGIFGRKAA